MTVINGHTTRATGTILTAAIYNTDHTNHVTNATNLNNDKIGGATPPVSDGHAVVFSGTSGFAVKTAGAAPVLTTQIGTSGGVLGLLNANKTDSGNNIFSGTNSFTGPSSHTGDPTVNSFIVQANQAANDAVAFIQNLNTTNVATKSAALRFAIRDTSNNFKGAGTIRSSPVTGDVLNTVMAFQVAIASVDTEVCRLASDGTLKVTHPTGGIGYGTGAGGTQAQITSKATGVTLSKPCGQITMNAASLAAGTIVSFVLTNTTIIATDTIVLNHISGGTPGSYTLNGRCAAGSATIDVRNNTAGALAEAIVIQFAVVKAVNA